MYEKRVERKKLMKMHVKPNETFRAKAVHEIHIKMTLRFKRLDNLH